MCCYFGKLLLGKRHKSPGKGDLQKFVSSTETNWSDSVYQKLQIACAAIQRKAINIDINTFSIGKLQIHIRKNARIKTSWSHKIAPYSRFKLYYWMLVVPSCSDSKTIRAFFIAELHFTCLIYMQSEINTIQTDMSHASTASWQLCPHSCAQISHLHTTDSYTPKTAMASTCYFTIGHSVAAPQWRTLRTNGSTHVAAIFFDSWENAKCEIQWLHAYIILRFTIRIHTHSYSSKSVVFKPGCTQST